MSSSEYERLKVEAAAKEAAKQTHDRSMIQKRLTAAYRKGYEDGAMAKARERSKRSEVLLPMHPGYMAWWVGLLGVILAADFLRAPWWVWLATLGVFLTIEGIAAFRHQRGDTFSELVWTFRAGGSDRRWLAYAVAIYLPLRFAMIGIPEVPFWIPRLVLAAGVIGWLLGHFNKLGRDG